MTWATDDRRLYWGHRLLDAAQADAARRIEAKRATPQPDTEGTTMDTATETELDPAAYLRDLASRLMQIPTFHGTDQGDVERLQEIASRLELAPRHATPLVPRFHFTLRSPTGGLVNVHAHLGRIVLTGAGGVAVASWDAFDFQTDHMDPQDVARFLKTLGYEPRTA